MSFFGWFDLFWFSSDWFDWSLCLYLLSNISKSRFCKSSVASLSLKGRRRRERGLRRCWSLTRYVCGAYLEARDVSSKDEAFGTNALVLGFYCFSKTASTREPERKKERKRCSLVGERNQVGQIDRAPEDPRPKACEMRRGRCVNINCWVLRRRRRRSSLGTVWYTFDWVLWNISNGSVSTDIGEHSLRLRWAKCTFKKRDERRCMLPLWWYWNGCWLGDWSFWLRYFARYFPYWRAYVVNVHWLTNDISGNKKGVSTEYLLSRYLSGGWQREIEYRSAITNSIDVGEVLACLLSAVERKKERDLGSWDRGTRGLIWYSMRALLTLELSCSNPSGFFQCGP